ncbi:DNA damage-regulated autophagy modulator protein 1 [Danio rerio]|uniref:DNA damage-regulated autophagy modulator protein 1 n=1 Tax=Danio rerio TaxID=7955 RepID=Q5XJL0_DANRE|nr:DNA damage-regulated autophagy modulator protein 1 [Danio rerio]AAH83290.1 Zgc:101811 [Danio rerio]|eukprot:NP_001006049.1 DNA damage-regulated autophagy modulator protein 1 [Danio rerio]
MFWFMEGMCFLPTFLVIWSSSTFIISYIIALYRQDVDVVLPYISDTGATPPESCVFGFMSTITAFAAFATMYAEYKFVERVHERTGAVPPTLNKVSFGFGIFSCIGMCLVATFQETTVMEVHDIGALLFFICGVVYAVIQSVIGYRAFPYGSSKVMCHLRTFFSTVAILAAIPTIACGFLVGTSKLHWDSNDKDYTRHIVSVACEWITTFSFVFFFLTYIQEFQQFTLKLTVNLKEYSGL